MPGCSQEGILPRDLYTQVSAQAGGPPAEARRGRSTRRMGVARDVKRIFVLVDLRVATCVVW